MDKKYLNENGDLKEGILSRFVNKVVGWALDKGKKGKLKQLLRKNPEIEDEVEQIEQARDNIERKLRDLEQQDKIEF